MYNVFNKLGIRGINLLLNFQVFFGTIELGGKITKKEVFNLENGKQMSVDEMLEILSEERKAELIEVIDSLLVDDKENTVLTLAT